MSITIRELIPEDFKICTGYFETLSNLRPSETIPTEKAMELLRTMNNSNIHVFVAVESKTNIVGTLSVVLEQKMIRGGVISAHIEEVVIHHHYQRLGIASQLLQRAIEFAKEKKMLQGSAYL